MGIKEGEKSWPSCVALFRAFQIWPQDHGSVAEVWRSRKLKVEKVKELKQDKCQENVSLATLISTNSGGNVPVDPWSEDFFGSSSAFSFLLAGRKNPAHSVMLKEAKSDFAWWKRLNCLNQAFQPHNQAILPKRNPWYISLALALL